MVLKLLRTALRYVLYDKKQTNRSSNLLNFFLWAVKCIFYNSFWEFFCFVYVHTSCHDEIYLDEPKQIGLINSYLYCIFNDTVLQHTLAPTTCLLNVLGSYTGTYNKIHTNKDNNSLWKAENKFPRQDNWFRCARGQHGFSEGHWKGHWKIWLCSLRVFQKFRIVMQ